jgi:hypothetical protein
LWKKCMLINLLCSPFTAVAAAVAWKHCQAYTAVSNTANFLWENFWIWSASWSIHSLWTDEESASLGLLRRTQVVLDCPSLVSCFSFPLHSSAPPDNFSWHQCCDDLLLLVCLACWRESAAKEEEGSSCSCSISRAFSCVSIWGCALVNVLMIYGFVLFLLIIENPGNNRFCCSIVHLVFLLIDGRARVG